jgi:hypothetical protein
VSQVFNAYVDESGHLEHDQTPVAVFGALWLPLDRTREVSERLREIKAKYKLKKPSERSSGFETKFTKTSPSRLPFYLDTLDYFFDDDDLRFRAIVVKDKKELDHERYGQTHDEWYYKMLYQLLYNVIDNTNHFRVYLDVKDTRSAERTRKLHSRLREAREDHEGIRFQRLQVVRSSESELLQLADLLIGIVGYANRERVDPSPAKTALVERMKKRSRYSLLKTTPLREEKTNLLVWRPRTD